MGDLITAERRWERFEQLLISVSSGFIDVQLEDIDAAVVKALEEICELFELDRSYVDIFDEQKGTSTILYEWARYPELLEASTDLVTIRTQDYLWWEYMHSNDVPVIVNTMSELPEMAWKEREYYERKHILSDVEVKISYGGGVLGFLGFSTSRLEKSWLAEEIRLFKVLADIIGGMLYRKATEENNHLKADLDELLIGISTEFIALPTQKLDAEITLTLKRIAERINSNRAYIYLMDEERKMQLAYEWHADDVAGKQGHIPDRSLDEYPWWQKMGRRNEGLQFTRLEELPAYALRERRFYEEIGTVSNIETNIFFRGELLGFIGFEAIGYAQNWNKSVMSMLRLLSEIFASAMLRRQTEEQLAYMSYHDVLTGLHNRAYFEKMIAQFDNAEYLPLSIINADINGLKLVNDTFGHKQGDVLLQKFANILQKTKTAKRHVFRWGGDEFIIILVHTGLQEAEAVARQIRKECANSEEMPLQLSVSLGISERTTTEKSMGELLREVEDRMYRNKLLEQRSVRSSLVFSLRESLAEKTLETEAHSRRLFDLAVKIGEKIGLAYSEIDKLSVLAMLHDIGKVAIPEHIIEKPGKLTEEEWEIIKQHPEIGYRIASSSQDLLGIADGILSHHERWDGFGYPNGLAGEEIPLISRILGIVDSFDVMVNGRPYKEAMSVKDALDEISRCAGSQFDPSLADVFIAVMSESDLCVDF